MEIKGMKNIEDSLSIQMQIVTAVNTVKKISERIVGFLPYNVDFVRATYSGKTRYPAKITALERAVIGILMIDGESAVSHVGAIVGLDVVNDNAEREIFEHALKILLEVKAVELSGGENEDKTITLNDGGKLYADKGERETYDTPEFELFVVKNHRTWKNFKNCISQDGKGIDEKQENSDDLKLSLEEIQSYAECQAKHVHYPQNRYELTEAKWKSGRMSSYSVYVCFVQNVATEEVRAFVYDTNTEALNEHFAQLINEDDILKAELLEQCIKSECQKDDQTEILEESDIEEAKAQITEELKEAQKTVVEQEKKWMPSKDGRLHKKALYDSISFEVELHTIFEKDDPEEIWLISPWIKPSAFLSTRKPLIEAFLKKNNHRIFIAYSEPSRSDPNDSPMIHPDVVPVIENWKKIYPNFFFVQLPEFHKKNVFEVKADQTILFSGSFNVLSFAVSKRHEFVRREEMSLAHHASAQKSYQDTQMDFVNYYAKHINEEIKTLDQAELEVFAKRIKYFMNLDRTDIREQLIVVEDAIQKYKAEAIESEVKRILNQINKDLSGKKSITLSEHSRIEKSLLGVRNKINNTGLDNPQMIDLLKDYSNQLSKLTIQENKTPHTGEKNILDEEPEATQKGLTLYLAKLLNELLKRNIYKSQLTDKLLKILKNKRYYDILSSVGIKDNNQNDDGFLLSIVIDSYIIYFSLSKNRNEFETYRKFKKVNNITVINKDTIETVIQKLSSKL